MFDKVPSLLLNWNALQVTDIFAYTQAFALYESLLFFGFLVFLAFLLPSRLFQKRFVSQATMIAFTLSIWAAGVHLIVRAYARSEPPDWNNLLFYAWCIGCLVLLIGLSWLIRTWPTLEKWIIARVEQATLLAYLFVTINVLGLIFVIIRNLFLTWV
jgi:hypothetical protein